MERYYKRASVSPSDNTLPSNDTDDFPWDPDKRKNIKDYNTNQVDEVRRKYLLRGPCQPLGHNFEKRFIGGKMRRFNPAWFGLYDDAYPGSVRDVFSNWHKPDRLSFHVGELFSSHNNDVKKCDDLMNQGQSIVHAMYKKTNAMKNEYRIRLNASVDISRYLLRQGLAFRGHREGEYSSNKGNFLELMKYTTDHNDVIRKVVLENALGNNKMVSSEIQKDIVNAFAEEVVKFVIEEIDNGVFGVLVDESADVSDKEQMAVVFRFVDKKGAAKERFVGVVHVKETSSKETSSLSLKHAIDELFAKYGLGLKKVRGQGYDRASNMKGEFNGLRSLITKENSSAYYVHCFAHQLQLVVMVVAKKIFEIDDFFDMVSMLLNVVGASCKRKDKVRENYRDEINVGIASGDINIEKGQNQEISFQRPRTTRWGSRYKTLLRLVGLFSTIIKVLKYIEEEGADDSKRCQAYGLLKYVQTFDCVFYIHLMLLILGICENLLMALQRKDQDILNAMSLVEST
uniref:DUF4371 domain-containing protein n=1 Tax=Brassica oleracea var. oleracea TaxID=109376 RepID=A0A0D2ZSH1_BRAOL